MFDKVEGRIEPGRETRLPFASQRYRAPTKDEFRSVTQTLGLTGSMVGALLGVTSRAVRKWIGGESEVPYSAWRLLLIHAGLAIEDPDQLVDGNEEYRRQLHGVLDKAIDSLKGQCAITVDYGTVSYPDEKNGVMKTKHTGAVTITIKPSNMKGSRMTRTTPAER